MSSHPNESSRISPLPPPIDNMTDEALNSKGVDIRRDLPHRPEASNEVERNIELDFAVNRDAAPPQFQLRKTGHTTSETKGMIGDDTKNSSQEKQVNTGEIAATDEGTVAGDGLRSAFASIESQIDQENETNSTIPDNYVFDPDLWNKMMVQNINDRIPSRSGSAAVETAPASETLVGFGGQFATNDAKAFDTVDQIDNRMPNLEPQDLEPDSTANSLTILHTRISDQPLDFYEPAELVMTSAVLQDQTIQNVAAGPSYAIVPASKFAPLTQQQSHQGPVLTSQYSLGDNWEHRMHDGLTPPTPEQNMLLQKQMEYQVETERLCEEWLTQQQQSRMAQFTDGQAAPNANATQQIPAVKDTRAEASQPNSSTLQVMHNLRDLAHVGHTKTKGERFNQRIQAPAALGGQSATSSPVSSTGKRTGKPRGRPPKPDCELKGPRRRISKNLPESDGYTQGTLKPQVQKRGKTTAETTCPWASKTLEMKSLVPFPNSSVVEDIVVNTGFIPNGNPNQQQSQNSIQYLPDPNARLSLDTSAEDFVNGKTSRLTTTPDQGVNMALPRNMQRGQYPGPQMPQLVNDFIAAPQHSPASEDKPDGGMVSDSQPESTKPHQIKSSMNSTSGYSMSTVNTMLQSSVRHSNSTQRISNPPQMSSQQTSASITPTASTAMSFDFNATGQTTQSAWLRPQILMEPTRPALPQFQQARHAQLHQSPTIHNATETQTAGVAAKRAASGQLTTRSGKRQRHEAESVHGQRYAQHSAGQMTNVQQMMVSGVATPFFAQAPSPAQSGMAAHTYRATMQPEDNAVVANDDAGSVANGSHFFEEHESLVAENATLQNLILANYEVMRRARLDGRSDQPFYQRLVQRNEDLKEMIQRNFDRMGQM